VQKFPITYWIERLGGGLQGKESLLRFFMKLVNGGICLGVFCHLAWAFKPSHNFHEGWCGGKDYTPVVVSTAPNVSTERSAGNGSKILEFDGRFMDQTSMRIFPSM